MYANGSGVAKNDANAVDWYTKAAGQGDANAQYNLGIVYAHGDGVAKNEATAVEWYTQAAKQGYADAQYNLGIMHEYGCGVEKNEATAVEWYTQAARQGHSFAQRALGKLTGDESLVNQADHDFDRVPIDLTNCDADGKPKELEHGDAVLRRFKVLGKPADHWAIYDKVNNRFIEVTGNARGGVKWASGSILSKKGSFASVCETSVADFNKSAGKQSGIEKVVWLDSAMSTRRMGAVDSAIPQIGNPVTYNIVACGNNDGKNCETFVRECYNGIPVSTQANIGVRETPALAKVAVFAQGFARGWNTLKANLFGTTI